MSGKVQGLVAALLVAGAALAVWLTSSPETSPEAAAASAMEGHDHAAMLAGSGQGNPVRLSAEGARRIGVSFATAERRSLNPTLATVGRVTYDETRLATVSHKVDGWVERLAVDYTGAHVRRGDLLLEIYSPRLVQAQEELILARDLAEEGGARASRQGRDLLESARRRLAYWDVSEAEIQAIESSGEVRRTLQLRSPANGIVVEKGVVVGDRVTPGTTLYRIADLSRVWVEADVYEKDLGLVREGLEAVITLESYPGRAFLGRVTYVYPIVSMEARTGSIRVELDNPRGELKPGMYANLRISAPPREPRIILPRSAVLDTGTRSLVFVAEPNGTLRPRVVATGFGFGDEIEILRGVEEGERVVSSASFLVDAESNLGQAMTLMEADTTPTGSSIP